MFRTKDSRSNLVVISIFVITFVGFYFSFGLVPSLIFTSFITILVIGGTTLYLLDKWIENGK